MNCANHSDTAAVAFCRTCGKPLCTQCTRDVRGVIYCESCLAARLDGTAPAVGFTPVQPPQPQTGYQQSGYQQFTAQNARPNVPVATGPNPTVAGILGAIPLGLGAVYCGQYAKGLVYLGIFVTCIVGVFRRPAVAGICRTGNLPGIFLGVSDSRRHPHRKSDSGWRTCSRSSGPGSDVWRQHARRETGSDRKQHQHPRSRRSADRAGRAVPDQHRLRLQPAPLLATDSDCSRGVAVRQKLGPVGDAPADVSLRTLPHAQVDGAGDPGYGGSSFPAR